MSQTPCRSYQDCDSAVDYTPSADVVAGDVIVVNSVPCIAKSDRESGELMALATRGLFKVPKKSGQTYAQFDNVFWDADGTPVSGDALSGAASNSSADGNLMGCAAAAAASGDEYVIVALGAFYATSAIGASITASDITGSDSSLGIAGFAAAQGGTVAIVGGTSSTGGNAGGPITVTGGQPGATGVGGSVTVVGGAGGSTSGTGGAVAVTGGAGTAGNANGGAVTIRGGAKNGSGTNGAIVIGDSNTASITVGAASVATSIVGPENLTSGASTAAAGSTNSDAAALPSGTAPVYPTTAADDTKGVIVSTSDKVTGRMIFIGNGVSNKILKVYGPSGATINGGSANAAFSSASGKGVVMYCLDSTANTWLAW